MTDPTPPTPGTASTSRAQPPVTPGIGVQTLRALGRLLLLWPRLLAPLLPVGWAALVFWLSSFPPSDRPPSWWELGGFTWNLGHPGAFGILAVLLVPVAGRTQGPWQRRWTTLGDVGAMWVVVAAALYGFTDELHQSTVPGRDASLLDLVSDTVGAAAAVWVVRYLGREGATGAGLRRRLGLGLLACFAAAGAATWWSHRMGGGPWPF